MDTQWRHNKSKISENLGRCGRQNMLRPYLKIWEWEWIFGPAVKAFSSLGVRSPWLILINPSPSNVKSEKMINWSRLWTSWKDYNSDEDINLPSNIHVSACYPCQPCYDCWHINRSIGLTRSCLNRLGPCRITETRQREDHFLLQCRAVGRSENLGGQLVIWWA